MSAGRSFPARRNSIHTQIQREISVAAIQAHLLTRAGIEVV